MCEIEKYVLALRCLNAAIALKPSHPRIHSQAVRFAKMIKSGANLPAKVTDVLKSEFKAVDSSADLAKLNADFEARYKDSALHVLSSVAVKRLLGQDKSQADKELINVLELPETTLAEAVEILSTLKGWKSTELAAFQEAAQSKWPEGTRLA
jgi:peptide alpha-N-acetyltransferase